MYMHIEVVLL